jgi:DNA primase
VNEVEEIKARLDIVEVIGQYVQLQKAGRTFKANCPFHGEKTPSFVVTPDRQSWHCFGACGTGGDVISFVMRKEGLDFPSTLRLLADRAGVKLPERRVSEREDRERQRLYEANDAASRYFRRLILEADAGREAREYVARRGIGEGTSEAFLIGYSPAGWDGLLSHLRTNGFTDPEVLRSGLAIQGDNGLYDRFRNRLMFPIRDQKGRIIGFGARALDNSVPKYLNTPQTALFDKGATLYALDRAEEAIRQEGRVVIVEGYMDVIAAHQHGFANVVAQMGTALTERQVRLIRKLAPEIVLALDADTAGSEATVRGTDVVREALAETGSAQPVVNWRGLVSYQDSASVELRVAVLPQGRDPDDVIRADADAWRGLIAGAEPVLDYRLNAAAAAHDLSDPRDRSRMVESYLPLLAAVADTVVRAHYLQRLARLAQVSEEDLGKMLGRSRGAQQRAAREQAQGRPEAQRVDAREEFLLALLLRFPDLRSEGQQIPETLFHESGTRTLFELWRKGDEFGAENSPVPVELAAYLERLYSRRIPEFDPKEAREALEDCRRRLERRNIEAEKLAISGLLAEREEELGAHGLVEAVVAADSSNPELRDAAELQLKDMETGLRLHERERRDGNVAVETRTDG